MKGLFKNLKEKTHKDLVEEYFVCRKIVTEKAGKKNELNLQVETLDDELKKS